MATETFKSGTTSDLYLKLLRDRGIEYLFVNPGTDFAPIIESYAKAETNGTKLPTPISVAHENVAVGMAHGYYLATGRMQAVMVHVNVGTANTVCGIINAAKDNVPVLMTAGRTPLTETELSGSRSGSIHWAQEMFDQAGMVRESVKWDYELRNGEQTEAVVDRAIEIANADPKGPVYLSLPREVLGYELKDINYESPVRRAAPSPAAPDTNAIDEAADLLANAERPLIVTRTGGRYASDAETLAKLAQDNAIPVSEFRPVYNAMPSDHEMNFGFDTKTHLEQADVVLALDADVPWLPAIHGEPSKDAKIIHMGADPLFQKYPIRGFTRDLAITSNLGLGLSALSVALDQRSGIAKDKIDTRRNLLGGLKEEQRTRLTEMREKIKNDSPIHPAWASHLLSERLDDDTLIFNDYPLLLPHMNRPQPHTYFGTPNAGGLGWGTGAALGAKLANPDKMVVSAVGDGSYMFGNPIAAHHVSKNYDLPVLFLIFNNSTWFAVKRATLGMYPDSHAAKSNRMPLTSLDPTPEFDKMMALYDGYGEKVEDPTDLPDALDRAIHAVKVERRQALLNIICTTAW
jgi:acetolactate synthase-1/2/3 large subunit